MSDMVQISMPQMGESVSEGTILTWHKQEGDWVDRDETIVEVSTDKVDAEVPSPAAGKLAKILAQEDETVAVGQPLAELEVDEAGAAAAREQAAAADAAPDGERATWGDGNRAGAAAVSAQTPAAVPEGARVSPVARRVAAAHGIDLGAVSGSGTGGRIVKEDVLSHVNGQSADGPAAPVAPPAEAAEEQPIRGV